MNGFDSVEEALEELRNGKIILVTDDPDREFHVQFESSSGMEKYFFLAASISSGRSEAG